MGGQCLDGGLMSWWIHRRYADGSLGEPVSGIPCFGTRSEAEQAMREIDIPRGTPALAVREGGDGTSHNTHAVHLATQAMRRRLSYVDALERYALASVTPGHESEAETAAADMLRYRRNGVPMSRMWPVFVEASCIAESLRRVKAAVLGGTLSTWNMWRGKGGEA